MEWSECIEEAKRELGITGWTDRWNNVIMLAKKKYWKEKSFQNLKNITIKLADNKCKLCSKNKNLTAHHIYYDSNKTICLCNECHQLVHEMRRYGFVMQLVLQHWDNINELYNKYLNLSYICSQCFNKLNDKIEERPNNDN